MNDTSVHVPNHTQGYKYAQRFVAGALVSMLLSACGGGGGISAEEQAARDAAAAQAAAAQAAAVAQAAADKAAALQKARTDIDTVAATISKEVQAAQVASSNAGYAVLRADQQATGYPEVASTLSQVKSYAATTTSELEKAKAEQARVAKLQTDVTSVTEVAAAQTLVNQAKTAEQAAKAARVAAEKALADTQAAATQLSDEIAAANASRRYTKLDSAGNALPASATSWACVKENATGKVWESKTNDDGLRDKDWRYRHLHNSAGYASSVDYYGKEELCRGIDTGSCDAYSYVNAVNNIGLCGRAKWRLPTMEELMGLLQINEGNKHPNIDLTFFPETINNPNRAAYCAENLNTYRTCASSGNYTIPTGVNPDARAECNYQGIDFGVYTGTPRSIYELWGGSMAPLRYYGEINGDGMPYYPNGNWLCYTRLISDR